MFRELYDGQGRIDDMVLHFEEMGISSRKEVVMAGLTPAILILQTAGRPQDCAEKTIEETAYLLLMESYEKVIRRKKIIIR